MFIIYFLLKKLIQILYLQFHIYIIPAYWNDNYVKKKNNFSKTISIQKENSHRLHPHPLLFFQPLNYRNHTKTSSSSHPVMTRYTRDWIEVAALSFLPHLCRIDNTHTQFSAERRQRKCSRAYKRGHATFILSRKCNATTAYFKRRKGRAIVAKASARILRGI